MYFIYVLSLFWYAVLTFPCVRIELSSQSFKCDDLGLWNLLAKLGWEKDDDREQQFDSLSRTTMMCHSQKEPYPTHFFDELKNQGPETGSNLSKVTQQREEWGQELRSSASFSPPPNSFLERVGFSWQLPDTRRQMGMWAGKIHKEGFGAHKWEILDNLSFLSEVTEMVKRELKAAFLENAILTSTKDNHFLWVFILSNCFHCTGFEPVQTIKAPLLFLEQNSVL